MNGVLRQYQSTLRRWGVSTNPFRPVPPDDHEQVAYIFHGRQEEVRRAFIPLYEGRTVLLRGAWGTGKTATLLYLLHRLQEELNDLGEKGLLLYLSMAGAGSVADFYRGLVLVLAEHMADQSDMAKDIAYRLRGFRRTRASTAVSGTVTLGFVSLSFERRAPGRELEPEQELDFCTLCDDLLRSAGDRFDRLILFIDDLDKQDPEVVYEILEQSLDMFRRGSRWAFAITGRGFTTTQEAILRALGIFSEDIPLRPMAPDDLYQIAINYLNTVREQPSDEPHPFTPPILHRIAQHAYGVPRQLQLICEKTFRLAAEQGVESIDEQAFPDLWHTIQREVIYTLDAKQRSLLYRILKLGGIEEDISDQELAKLGVHTFLQLLPILKTLEESDFLLRDESATGYRYRPSELISLLKEEGTEEL